MISGRSDPSMPAAWNLVIRAAWHIRSKAPSMLSATTAVAGT